MGAKPGLALTREGKRHHRHQNASSRERKHKAGTAKAEVIGAVVGISLPRSEKEEADLDNAFKQLIRESADEARAEGRAQGRAEGRAELCEQFLAKYRGELPPELAAEMDAMVSGGRTKPVGTGLAASRS